MNTKLTLNIDKKVIVSTKKYAQLKGQSLPNIIENYLTFVSSNLVEENEITPTMKRLMGVIKLPKNDDYKNDLTKAFSKKHKI